MTPTDFAEMRISRAGRKSISSIWLHKTNQTLCLRLPNRLHHSKEQEARVVKCQTKSPVFSAEDFIKSVATNSSKPKTRLVDNANTESS